MSKTRAEQIIRQLRLKLLLSDNYRISPIGAGENHLNYLLVSGNKKLVLRINLRKNEASRLEKERKILKRLPKNIGPRVILQGNDYLVVTFIEGKPLIKWNAAIISKVARTLALLHKNTAKNKSCFLLQQFDEWYSKQTIKPYPQLYTRIRSEMKNANICGKTSLVHGDACCDNIIISKTASLVDWESAHMGDPAGDIARLYYPGYELSPWFCKISEQQVKAFIIKYQTLRNDKDLSRRVGCWNTVLMFLDMHYYFDALTKKCSQEKRKRYRKGIKILEQIFQNRYGLLG